MADASVDRWQLLVSAALATSDEDPTVRFAQLATVDRKGNPYNRTVVIRAFRSERSELQFVTDARSQKVAHLRANSRVALCWYLTSARQQFRFRGAVTLVDVAHPSSQDARRSAWATLSDRTRQQFYWPAPGTRPVDESPKVDVSPGRALPDTFVLLRFYPDFVDHLVLASTPHRRTFYRLDDAGHWHRQPVNP